MSVLGISCDISTLKSDVKNYVHRTWKNIAKGHKNLFDLFSDLNATVWTIVDHYLLDYLVGKHGSKELQEKMDIYSSKLQEFKKSTRITDFITCWKEAQKERKVPGLDEVKIKSDTAELFPTTLDCASIIHFGSFKKGCFIVTFQVPKEMTAKLATMDVKKCQLFDDFKVVHISIGDKKMYEDFDRGK